MFAQANKKFPVVGHERRSHAFKMLTIDALGCVLRINRSEWEHLNLGAIPSRLEKSIKPEINPLSSEIFLFKPWRPKGLSI